MTGARLANPTGPSAHVDTYVRNNLPAAADWPRLDYSTLPTLAAYPARINAAVELLDCHVNEGRGARPALWFEGQTVTYADLLAWVNRLARVLTEDLGVVPGNRVLLRGFNSPGMVAAWLAVLKAGARDQAAIADRLKQSGIVVSGIAPVQPSLEDVFLEVAEQAGRA